MIDRASVTPDMKRPSVIRIVFSLLLLPLALPAEFDLRELKWRKRIVLIFAPANEQTRLLGQRRILESASCGLRDRDIVTILAALGEPVAVDGSPVGASAGDALRSRYRVNPDEFAVLLIGKDGGVKLRRNSQVSAQELFSRIDAMPMRRGEIKTRAGNLSPCSDG